MTNIYKTRQCCSPEQHSLIWYVYRVPLLSCPVHSSFTTQKTGMYLLHTPRPLLCCRTRITVTLFQWMAHLANICPQVYFSNVCIVTVTAAFPQFVCLGTQRAEWYRLSTRKSLVRLSSINKLWEHNKKSRPYEKIHTCDSFNLCHICEQLVQNGQVHRTCMSALLPQCEKYPKVTNVFQICHAWEHQLKP